MAEGILRRLLDEAGITATIGSAGLHEGGAPATPNAVEVLRDAGIDISSHRSRDLATLDDVALADLVIGMERRHVQEAVVLEPGVRSRSFTLPELARRATAAPPRAAGVPLRAWAESLSAGRTAADLLGTADAVADPIGSSKRRYQATAELLFDLLQSVVQRAWPAAESGAA
jgi:protein-tyrosine-phosphatase